HLVPPRSIAITAPARWLNLSTSRFRPTPSDGPGSSITRPSASKRRTMRLIDAGDRSRPAASSGLVVAPADRMASSTRNWLVSVTDDRVIDFFLTEITETLKVSGCTGQGAVSASAGIRAVQQPRRSQRNPRTLHSCLNVKRRGTLERQAAGVRWVR